MLKRFLILSLGIMLLLAMDFALCFSQVELSYDRGNRHIISPALPGAQGAVYFTVDPDQTPFQLSKFKAWFAGGGEALLHIYEDDPPGTPGKDLVEPIPLEITDKDTSDWFVYDFLELNLTLKDNFWIASEYTMKSPSIWIDTTIASGHSYVKLSPLFPWQQLPKHDALFRAVIIPEKKTETKVEAESGVPHSWALSQNYPNPFNPTTTVRYVLAQPGQAVLDIFDLRGQRIRRLVDGSKLPGVYEVSWDGLDDTGREVGSGVYLCRLRTAGFTAVRKMTLLQ